MRGDYFDHLRQVQDRENAIASNAYQQGYEHGLSTSSNYHAGFEQGKLEAIAHNRRKELRLWFIILVLILALFCGIGGLTSLIQAIFHPPKCEQLEVPK